MEIIMIDFLPIEMISKREINGKKLIMRII